MRRCRLGLLLLLQLFWGVFLHLSNTLQSRKDKHSELLRYPLLRSKLAQYSTYNPAPRRRWPVTIVLIILTTLFLLTLLRISPSSNTLHFTGSRFRATTQSKDANRHVAPMAPPAAPQDAALQTDGESAGPPEVKNVTRPLLSHIETESDKDKSVFDVELPPEEEQGTDGPAQLEVQVVEDGDPLVECKKTMLFKFSGLHGFGSEIGIMLRLHALARHHRYSLLIDSSEWNYGPFSSYFELPQITCLPPPSNIPRTRMRFTSSKGKSVWTKKDHVRWTRDVNALDDFFAATFVDPIALDEIHTGDGKSDAQLLLSAGLTPEETVPIAFHRAYRELQRSAVDLWRPNSAVRRMMAELEERLGIADAPRDVVAVHVRLGDKHLELDQDVNRGPGLHDQAIKTYFGAAQAVIDSSLLDPEEPVHDERIDVIREPLMVIMSDDPHAWSEFNKRGKGSGFKVIGTAGNVGGEGTAVNAQDLFSANGGFHETAFNQLPLQSRIEITKPFVRDLTLLAQTAKGLVITGSSNVGRLMALLANDAIENARVRSVDVRWYPTGRYL